MKTLSVSKRQEIINNEEKGIPAEGALSYTSLFTQKQFDFSQEQADRIINSFFEGKTPPPAGEQLTAEILLGAPGSGKSIHARERYEGLSEEERAQTIFVSYDETGAIFAIDEYLNGLKEQVEDFTDEHSPVSDESLKVRTELWDDYRQFSQYIRNGILKRALSEGYNVMIDTTSSSLGSVKLAENVLQPLGYEISVVGTYAPFDVAVERLHSRVRPASDEEAVTKRLGDPEKNSGALNMLKPMMAIADHFEYYYNPRNDQSPELAFSYDHGALTYSNARILDEMRDQVRNDMDAVLEFIDVRNVKFSKLFDEDWVNDSAVEFINTLSKVNADLYITYDL